MTSTDEAPDRGGRVLRIALIASLLVHVIVGIIYLAATDELSRLLARVAVQQPKPKPDEVVTIALSSALKIEKKARPAPAHPARPRPQVPQRVAVVPKPVVQPKPLVQPKPVVQPQPVAKPRPVMTARPVPTPKPEAAPTTSPLPFPSALEKELSKFDRRARPQVVAAAPRPNPVLQSQPNPQTQPQPATEAQPQVQPQPPNHATLTQEQIDQIDRDLSKTIEQSRTEDRILSDTAHAVQPAAPKRFALNMAGIESSRYGAQGVC